MSCSALWAPRPRLFDSAQGDRNLKNVSLNMVMIDVTLSGVEGRGAYSAKQLSELKNDLFSKNLLLRNLSYMFATKYFVGRLCDQQIPN